MFKFALGNLGSRPVRSALSILGLTVAIAGMVGLFSIAGGIDQLVSSTFDMIPGLLVQQQGAPVPLFSTLPAAWREELEQIDGVSVVNPQILVRANVIEGKSIISPPRFLLGVDIPSRLQLAHGVYVEHLDSGRFLQVDDAGTMNCVVARQIAEEFGKQLGDTLTVNGQDVTIVGTYFCNSMLLDVSIVMDIGSVRNISRFDPQSVSVYYMETTGARDDEELSREIEQHFADRDMAAWDPGLALGPLLGVATQASSDSNPVTEFFSGFDRSLKGTAGETAEADEAAKPQASSDAAETTASAGDAVVESPIEVRSADDWAAKFDEFSADLNLFLTLMTAIGVVIAVLSIVNTMLMSVTERRTEFGVLRANGWSRRHILGLVTYESALLGVVGGLLGALLGWLATHAINWSFPDRVNLHAGIGLLTFSVAFSIILGVLGGLYPAWQAARLSPMEAIRRG
ncbi:MAG: ABC transporter permease [Planctomycetaceae bacterium]|nr:ABC transporter permease [Planctomycetaceae bacterium]